ncbi:FtsK/SpoIIIE domain-containing protein, partial [Nocardia sp. NPDC049220]
MKPERVSQLRRVLRPAERYMRACSWWIWHRRALVLTFGLIGLVWWGFGTLTGRPDARTEGLCFLVVGLAPGVVCGFWFGVAPVSYERRVAGPSRRRAWKKWARREWVDVASSCGLSTKKADGTLVVPRVLKRSARGETLTLKVRVQRGLTPDAITRALPAIATTANALAWSARTVAPGTVVIALTMRDALALPITAGFPELVLVDELPIGRKVDGSTWRLGLLGRHTLVVGASGSGKGSIFWGIAANLGPAVNAGLVKLWGIDLKRGLEVRVGEGLFHAVADNPSAAIAALKAVLRVIDERGAAMAGKSRLHKPSKGAPLHVVMVDEVAVLTAYA